MEKETFKLTRTQTIGRGKLKRVTDGRHMTGGLRPLWNHLNMNSEGISV